MENAGERNAQQAQEDTEIEMDLAAEDADALGATEKAVELVEHADAAAGESGEGGSGDAELGERSQPKMRQGSRTRLMMLDTQSKRMAIAASPAPRKMALLRKSNMMAPLPPRAMRA